ncbi:hypothetical protein SAMN04487989_107114 [Bizionia echini]|uniref:DUF2306 domain-containing protein n=1 Tax=Bizionia echini TaxID=649333 RepID=A0A1I5DAX2_9FLAO|nr:hypothetical protein [Bizionia echini]SFN96414.1 hypothetical protein SAMN04487989_107114 [Bizionia echini]
MEDIIKIAIYIHAFFGGIGLITGIASIIVKKGSKNHKRMGKLFSIGMFTSSLISVPISWMPNHENLFLFVIGVFTMYLVLSGNRALTFKNKAQANWIDKSISGIMLLFSIFMMVFGIYLIFKSNTTSVLFLFFGVFGLRLTCIDFKFFKNPQNSKNAWLIAHLIKMNGALIASITAFVIAGVGISNLIAWLTPTLLGTIYIVYWKRKTKAKMLNKQTAN